MNWIFDVCRGSVADQRGKTDLIYVLLRQLRKIREKKRVILPILAIFLVILADQILK